MNLKNQMGEFQLIAKFRKRFSDGIGDDCAVIPFQSGRSYLVTTDTLVEGIHFRRSTSSAQDIGWKAVAVNLSDIAAMGGTPRYAFLSLSLPSGLSAKWIRDFTESVAKASQAYRVAILGGNTTRSLRHIVITLTVIGSALLKKIKLRSMAKCGDIIAVTDFLGDSGAGLRLLGMKKLNGELQHRHRRPFPQIQEGLWLANQKGVRAMIDVSDGIASDLCRIAEESRCGAYVFLEKLPISDSLYRVGRAHRWDTRVLAATAGEDYCLCVTVDPRYFDDLAAKFLKKFGRPLADIGRITPKSKNKITFFKNGRPLANSLKGFDHFWSRSMTCPKTSL